MALYRTSINRPVLATVMSLVIVLFGVISYSRLGIREYPSVDPPIITVSSTYTGAPPEVVESQITEPLEENINAVAGIRTMTSVSREGRSTITVEFDLETDLEVAANEVRDRASRAQRDLPPDADPPIISKADSDRQPITFLSVFSPSRDLLDLSDFADRRFKPVLQTIPGVAEVDIWGEKRFAMRLWLDRDRMAAYGLTPVDVRDALERENVELPSGRIEGGQVEVNVRAISRFTNPEEFNQMVIREEAGRTVRLQDIGYAVIGPENQRSVLKRNGIPMVGVVIRPQPGANQIDISDEFRRRVELVKRDLPDDIEVSIGFDNTEYIRASITEVKETIFIALGLVVLIIFLFLRSLRSTLIPAVVIPVSLIGGFAVMYAAGFSINVLTLLAMVLAIGLVVDDAIIVLENIYAKIEAGLSPREAGYEGTKEIFFAVIATTIALVSVFLPLLFLGGVVGQLFREFAVVIGSTVAISSFVALTLTPMLCTKILKAGRPSRFYLATEPFFNALTNAYRATLTVALKVRFLGFLIIPACGLLAWGFLSVLPSELAPLEDRGRLRISATAPEGASYDYISDYMDSLSNAVMAKVPESSAVLSITSPGFGAASSVNSGFIRHLLVPASERERSQADISGVISEAARELAGARVSVIQDPTISGSGGGSRLPIQFVIQAPNLDALRGVLPEFIDRASQSPIFSQVESDLKFNKPELQVTIDRERAQNLGVSARDIGETLNLALSEQRFGYFLRDGKQYFVLGALVREDRNENRDLSNLTVPSINGAPVRLDNLVRFSEEVSPPQLYRFNRYLSATVLAGLNPGYTLGQGVAEMERIAAELLDESFQTDVAGEARDLRETSSSIFFAFVLALLLIYLALCAQFESFRDPLTVMLTVPLALVGATAALWVTGQTLNIFSQIGIIMLIGLVTKNGILIVEFANQRKAEGLSPLDAVRDAATARFRPVLMTSLSTILGILPIALALGAGSESRRSMGIAVIGGMVIGSLLTLYVIPMLYAYITSFRPQSPAPPSTPQRPPVNPIPATV